MVSLLTAGIYNLGKQWALTSLQSEYLHSCKDIANSLTHGAGLETNDDPFLTLKAGCLKESLCASVFLKLCQRAIEE